ncbi:MAG TPA: Nif3-like dinuclear metal center hexameric protein [Coriobacteriia bacterium]|nr:Nif3-like dinuclear metal center hexameric protein [Coriobacteriia bacterium]
MTVTVRDIERALLNAFPFERAEGWDRGGLLAGDPDREVTGVVLALDPTISALSDAASMGANVLVTHHPVFLEPPKTLKPGAGPGGVVFAALDAGIALINCHTNLDRDAQGQRLIPEALGLSPVAPLERGSMPMSLVTVYVPEGAREAVTAAMAGAGAGRIGDYTGCNFTDNGVGRFTPSTDAAPCVGAPGTPSEAEEARVEMVCARGAATSVLAAAIAAHPYEEPLVTVSDVAIARNGAAMGMVCDAGSVTLRELVERCASTFGVTPRVWGDPDTTISRLVTSTGSAGALLREVRACGAQALVAGEVRYHDALDAMESGLAIVELGHDVSEWPLVTLLERVVRGIDGLDPDTIVSLPATAAWWTP